MTPDMVVWTYSGIRPLFDDKSATPQEATRDYVLKLDRADGAAPLLSIFGGKITTYRRLAESALELLLPYLPAATGRPAGWTGREPLPGGDFPIDGFAAELAKTAARYPFLPAPLARRLLRAYGTDIRVLLQGASCMADLGPVLGADLTGAEIHYLARYEWAMTADDIVWRRSKLGLRMKPAEIAAIDEMLARINLERRAAE